MPNMIVVVAADASGSSWTPLSPPLPLVGGRGKTTLPSAKATVTKGNPSRETAGAADGEGRTVMTMAGIPMVAVTKLAMDVDARMAVTTGPFR